MTIKTVTSLALAAGCAIALSIPAQAQTYNSWGGNAALNNAESARYDQMVQTSPGFRQARMHKECGPITDPQLRQSCMASFGQHESQIGSSGRTMAGGTTQWSPGTTTRTGDFYTGSSTNPGMTGSNHGTDYGAGWGGLGTTPSHPGPRPSGSGGGTAGSGIGTTGAGR
jgi:hypothetical protein